MPTLECPHSLLYTSVGTYARDQDVCDLRCCRSTAVALAAHCTTSPGLAYWYACLKLASGRYWQVVVKGSNAALGKFEVHQRASTFVV